MWRQNSPPGHNRRYGEKIEHYALQYITPERTVLGQGNDNKTQNKWTH